MRTIRVTGKGQIRVRPDMARITVTLTGLYKEYSETLRRSSADTEALKLRGTENRRVLRGGRDRIIRAIAAERYGQDASSAFVRNDALYRHVRSLMQGGDIEGVVYHVLKGQIEYDFELERFEELFAELGIPVFRLETDYQYQDVEQLRIRMEAFSEMLTQNRYREVKKAQ